jgi:hypothetical protein
MLGPSPNNLIPVFTIQVPDVIIALSLIFGDDMSTVNSIGLVSPISLVE